MEKDKELVREATLETQWEESQPRCSLRRWIEIFPEGKRYLRHKNKKIRKEQKILERKIIEQYKWILKEIKPENKWFWKQYTGLYENDLQELRKQIRRLEYLTRNEKSQKGNNGVKEIDIERAKEVPFDALIKFNRAKFALCPFHSEKTPSLHWNKKKNRIKCFGCGIYMDTIDFVMETKEVDFIRAVRMLAK